MATLLRIATAGSVDDGKSTLIGRLLHDTDSLPLDHLDAVDPDARAARMAKDKALIDRLRERVGGKYASGGVNDKIDAAKQQQAAFEQAQMGFFSSEDAPDASAGGQPASLGADERHTLGHAAERQIAAMMGHVGANFKPGQPTGKVHNLIRIDTTASKTGVDFYFFVSCHSSAATMRSLVLVSRARRFSSTTRLYTSSR